MNIQNMAWIMDHSRYAPIKRSSWLDKKKTSNIQHNLWQDPIKHNFPIINLWCSFSYFQFSIHVTSRVLSSLANKNFLYLFAISLNYDWYTFNSHVSALDLAHNDFRDLENFIHPWFLHNLPIRIQVLIWSINRSMAQIWVEEPETLAYSAY